MRFGLDVPTTEEFADPLAFPPARRGCSGPYSPYSRGARRAGYESSRR